MIGMRIPLGHIGVAPASRVVTSSATGGATVGLSLVLVLGDLVGNIGKRP